MPRESLILIVDDEPLGRHSLRALLHSEGYRLEVAASGPEALQMAVALTPDLILLDVMMPGMDGYEVTRRLRATGSLAEVPILMLTALDDGPARLAGLAAGADDFISKPFDRVELRARIRTVTRLNRFRRLLLEREKYRLLFSRSPCGLLIVDGELQIVEANAVASSFLDQLLDPGTPRTLLHLVPEAETVRLRELLVAAVIDPATTPRAEFMTARRDRTPCWFELTVSASPAGGTEAYQVAFRDLTAERLLEAEQRHAQKIESIGQLAGGIAHDFNNLLTVINGVSESLLAGVSRDDPLWVQLRPIHEAGEQAARLTRQLLAFSRKQALSPVDLDLNALVAGLEAMLRRLLGEDILLATQLDPALGLIRADHGQIEQVLINLAINARDAMPVGGTLSITTRRQALSHVRLVVADTGQGMAPEILARIFEPFFTTKHEGTGLGLATSFGIVKQSGGTLEVTSEPGRGTRFDLVFPRVDPASTGDTPPRPRSPSGGWETILLAEDEDAVRTFARMALEAAGYVVIAASDGEEALRASAAHEGPIHLLVTDVIMPRLSGPLLAEALRTSRPEARVLYVSGYTADAALRLGKRVGDSPFLQKPYTPTSLLHKVRELLDAPPPAAP